VLAVLCVPQKEKKMKTNGWTKGSFLAPVVGVALVIALTAAIKGQEPRSSADNGAGKDLKSADYKLSGPFSYKNLTVFLIHGPDKIKGKNFLTLQEALDQKKVVVFETGSVNELAIQNHGNEDVYVQSGEIVKGGQQDRVLAVDLIVPARSQKIPIAAFCVESGRWSKRGSEEVATFASSSEAVATKDLKLAAKVENSQGAVWSNVTVAQEKLSANVGERVNSSRSDSSLQLAVENRKVKENVAGYTKKLSPVIDKNDVIGYVFAINGKVNSADVYASHALFVKLWPKLLKSSATEALAEFEKDAKYESLSQQQAQAFLVESEEGAASEQVVTPRVKLVTRHTKENVFFETRDADGADAWVHRNYIKKN
jgi:hypothetical protein